MRRPRDDRAGCLLVSSAGSPRDLRSVAQLIPKEEGRLLVIMDAADPEFTVELARRLRPMVPLRWHSVRLVASGAAADPDGDCPARELSHLLDTEVIAPDGEVVVLPNGSLFVTDAAPVGRPGAAGAWWQFLPSRVPVRLGRRYPAPGWEATLGVAVPEIPGLVVEEVPSGLWVHRPPEVHVGGLTFRVPMHAHRMLLLVSRPGDPGLSASDLDRLIRALPDALHDRLVVVPYGDSPLVDGHLGTVAARAANQPVRVRTGLPLYVRDVGVQVLAVGATGVPTWYPFARELIWTPDGSGRILKGDVPVDYLKAVAPGLFAIGEQWLMEVVESGLWIRKHDRVEGAQLVRMLPVDSRHCNVVLGAFSDHPSEPPWRAVAKLLRKLPDDAKSRIRLAVPEAAGHRIARGAADALEDLLNGQPLVLLANDGAMRPWRPSAHPSSRP